MSIPGFLFDDFDTPEQPASDGPLTVRALVARYLDHLALRVQAQEYSRAGFKDVQRDLRRFAAAPLDKDGRIVATGASGRKQGERLLTECRRSDLLDWIQSNPAWRSNSTKKRNLSEICACWAWALDEGLIDQNPYRRPRGLKLRTRRRPDAQPSQYVAFLRVGRRHLRRVLYFLWNSGARPAEARELTWPMLHLAEGVAVIDKHKTLNSQEEHRPRIIGLEPRLIRFLQNLYRQRLPGQEHVFVNGRGEPWTKDCLQRSFWRCRDKILRDRAFALKHGVDKTITVYCIRHGYVTEGIMAGIGERQIADQIGHADTRLINHYSHAATKARHLRSVAKEIRRKRRESRKEDGNNPKGFG